MPTLPQIDAGLLRALAEAADSRRGTDVVLAWDANAKPPVYKIVDDDKKTPIGDPMADGSLVVLRLLTNDYAPAFVPRSSAFTLMSDPAVSMVRHNGMGIATADAVFTTLPAVEKFVLPYYAHLKTVDEVATLRARFATTATALAMVHLPDSVEDEVSAGLYALLPPRDYTEYATQIRHAMHDAQGRKLMAVAVDEWVKNPKLK